MAVVLVLVIVSGLSYLYGTKSSQSFVTTKPIISKTITTPTPDSTNGWKAYISHNGYELKYPKDWELKTENWKEGVIQYGLQPDDEVIIRFSEINQPPHGGFPYGATLTLKNPQNNPKNLTAIEYAKSILNSTETKTIFEPITISDINSTKATSEFNGRNTNIIIPYKGKIYRIIFNIFTTEDQITNYDKLFDQILSTFQFTDSTTPTDTANWKTYSSTQSGYNFKYPNLVQIQEDFTNSTVKAVYIGEEQRKSGRISTEIADGYMFIISEDPSLNNKSLTQYTSERYNNQKKSCPVPEKVVMGNIQDVTISGQQAKTYQVTNCMGDYQLYFVSHKQALFIITLTFNGNTQTESEYQLEAKKILSTFQFAN
jgi:hypothetical protein